jgi:two-component system, NarL family, nitrate/nitrite response regulator NarL
MIPIAVVEDNRLVRDGLTLKLNEQSDLTVAYSSSGGSIEGLRESGVEVLLLDAGLVGDDSLQLAERIRTELPDLRVIVMDLLPAHQDLVEFVNAGVAGFVLKEATLDDLFATIRAVAGGQDILPPEMTSTLFSQIVEEAVLRGIPAAEGATELTPQERKVVGLIGDGLSNKAIAKALAISPHTVKSHVRNVMDKLALHSRLQIAAYLHRSTEEGEEE